MYLLDIIEIPILVGGSERIIINLSQYGATLQSEALKRFFVNLTF